MNLENLYYVGQTVAVVAILASLLFVGFQVRQNSKHMRAQIQSARVDRLMAQMIGFSDADKCAAYIIGNGEEATPEAIKERQFYLLCMAQLGVMVDVFHQYKDGLLNEEQFIGAKETYRRWLQDAGFRTILMEFRENMTEGTPDFGAFLFELMSANDKDGI